MKTKLTKQKAFTIIELLTVMSIIVILIGLLVPALSKVRRFATDVKQRAQLHSIEAALELFNNEYEGYPDSSALDSANQAYCGAMKLCEAMMGQDLMGYHPKSRFLLDGTDGSSGNPIKLYEPGVPDLESNLKSRKGTYLPEDNANAFRLVDIYPATDLPGNFTALATQMFVLCDVYKRVENLGDVGDSKIGMPILYYRADSSGSYHDPNNYPPTRQSNNGNIYNAYDNDDLVQLGKPWEASGSPQKVHALGENINNFYDAIENKQIQINSTNPGLNKRPYKADTYILISAGYDGEYGTLDDITNFELK